MMKYSKTLQAASLVFAGISLSTSALCEIIADPTTQRDVMNAFPQCVFPERSEIEEFEYCPDASQQLEENIQSNSTTPCPKTTTLEISCPVIHLNKHGESVILSPKFWFSESNQCWAIYNAPVARCVPEFWSDKVDTILWDHAVGGVESARLKLCERAPQLCNDKDEPQFPQDPRF